MNLHALMPLHGCVAGVKAPNMSDWKKLMRLLKCLNGTRDDALTLSADDLHVNKWYVDAAFAVHPDFKSHAGGIIVGAIGTMLLWLLVILNVRSGNNWVKESWCQNCSKREPFQQGHGQ